MQIGIYSIPIQYKDKRCSAKRHGVARFSNLVESGFVSRNLEADRFLTVADFTWLVKIF